MNRLERYNLITGDTVVTKFRSNKEYCKYHCFNANGMVAKKHALDNLISDYVSYGVLRSGWLVAHGGLNTFHVDLIVKYAMQGRVSRFNAHYHVDALKAEIEATYTQLAEVIMRQPNDVGTFAGPYDRFTS